MSLLLKALSRVEQRQQAPANDAQKPPVDLAIPPVISLPPVESPIPVAKETPPPAPIVPPVESLIPPAEPAVATVEPAAPSVEKIDQVEPAMVAPELPIVEPLAEIPDTAGDFSTALDAAMVADVRVVADSPTADPITLDIAADQPAPFATPIAQPTQPLEIDTTLLTINAEPPAAPPTAKAAAPAAEIAEPLADVPPPVADASETYTDFFADLRDDLGNEPIWQQLEDLQRLVASDLGRFNTETVSLEDSGDSSIEVTTTEVLEIEAIDLPEPNAVPLTASPPTSSSTASIPPVSPAEQFATAFPPFKSLSEPATTVPPFVSPPLSVAAPVEAIPALIIAPSPAPTPSQPVATAAPLNFKPEFRELRDQLLARINIAKHPTLLMVDAGQGIGDSSWLLPLATSIIEKLNATKRDTPPQILIVEAAGSDCGIAQSLGLDAHLGLNHVLARRTDWNATVQSTPHPQIKLLGRGAGQLRSGDFNRLAKCWAELSLRFDLILVAAGPIYDPPSVDQIQKTVSSSATMFFPLTTAAVLCIELNGTPQSTATEAKRFLDARGIQVLGCIVQPTW